MSRHPTATPTLLTFAIAAALGAGTAQAQQPYEKPDGAHVSISGTVASPSADEFVLDYGSGTILVEMDDWDSYGDAHGLMDGDKVTVFGRIDDDFFEVAKIEAGSVYVENLNTYFYASSADEETQAYNPRYWTAPAPIVVSAMTLRGDVTAVDSEERTFTIDTGGSMITVEVDDMGYNPLDDNGFQQIDVGDYVSVSGIMDYELMDGGVFEADVVTTLVDEQAS
jgi:uncharacterized protein YdeI (BOF family)